MHMYWLGGHRVTLYWIHVPRVVNRAALGKLRCVMISKLRRFLMYMQYLHVYTLYTDMHLQSIPEYKPVTQS